MTKSNAKDFPAEKRFEITNPLFCQNRNNRIKSNL